jgi:hypothetical protein
MGTVHREQVPRMKQVAAENLARLGAAIGQMNARLAEWLSAEAAAGMAKLSVDAGGEFVEYLVGAGLAGAELAGGAAPTIGAIAADLLFTALDVDGAAGQQRDTAAAIADHQLLGGFVASAGARATTHATARVAQLASWFAATAARLEDTVGPDRSMRILIDINKLVEAAQPLGAPQLATVVDLHQRGQLTTRQFDQHFREVGVALGTIVAAANRAGEAARQAIGRIMDAYLRYRAGGPRPGTSPGPGHEPPTKARIEGNLNLAGARPRLTLNRLSFGGYQPGTIPMKDHVDGKTLRDLPGWDVTVAVVLEDGSHVTLTQRADGTRTAPGGDAAARASTILWQMLDQQPFGRYWQG